MPWKILAMALPVKELSLYMCIIALMSLISCSSLTFFGFISGRDANGLTELKYSLTLSFSFAASSPSSFKQARYDLLATSIKVSCTARSCKMAVRSCSTTLEYKLSKASSSWSSVRFPGANNRNPRFENLTVSGDRFGWLFTVTNLF